MTKPKLSEHTKCYRIVEEKNGEYYSLFHGTDGSRKLEKNKWLKANIKTVSDGSKGTRYEAGFHVLLDKGETDHFFKTLFKVHKNRKVIAVYVKDLRPKVHSRHEIFLADEMFIPDQ